MLGWIFCACLSVRVVRQRGENRCIDPSSSTGRREIFSNQGCPPHQYCSSLTPVVESLRYMDMAPYSLLYLLNFEKGRFLLVSLEQKVGTGLHHEHAHIAVTAIHEHWSTRFCYAIQKKSHAFCRVVYPTATTTCRPKCNTPCSTRVTPGSRPVRNQALKSHRASTACVLLPLTVR